MNKVSLVLILGLLACVQQVSSTTYEQHEFSFDGNVFDPLEQLKNQDPTNTLRELNKTIEQIPFYNDTMRDWVRERVRNSTQNPPKIPSNPWVNSTKTHRGNKHNNRTRLQSNGTVSWYNSSNSYYNYTDGSQGGYYTKAQYDYDFNNSSYPYYDEYNSTQYGEDYYNNTGYDNYPYPGQNETYPEYQPYYPDYSYQTDHYEQVITFWMIIGCIFKLIITIATIYVLVKWCKNRSESQRHRRLVQHSQSIASLSQQYASQPINTANQSHQVMIPVQYYYMPQQGQVQGAPIYPYPMQPVQQGHLVTPVGQTE